MGDPRARAARAERDGRHPLPDRHEFVRQVNEQAVLDVIFSRGGTSRVEIAQVTGLSKPTVSSLVVGLERMGLVRQVGVTSGAAGRNAALYAVDAHFGHVVAIDVGATKLRLAVSDLFGEVLTTTVERTSSQGGDALVEQIADLTQRTCADVDVPWSSVRAVVVGTPGVLDPASDRLRLASNLHGLRTVPFSTTLRERLGATATVENDVNLAAVGEHWRGCAADRENFVFLAIGTGIGMGLVLDGELFRGARGAAGEISFLPLGGDPWDRQVRRRGAFESAAAGAGLGRAVRDRLRQRHPETKLGPRASAKAIFKAAAERDPLGLELVDEEARVVALAILSVCAVLDPELVVLGGGIGANPSLLDPVRRHLKRCMPYDIVVKTSELGELAAIHGALAVGLKEARAALLPHAGGRAREAAAAPTR